MAAFLGKKNLAGRTIDEDTTPSTAYPSQMNTVSQVVISSDVILMGSVSMSIMCDWVPV